MDINLFELLSFILAGSAFIKVFFGVFYHERLYQWARHHYSQKERTFPVNLLLVYAVLLLVLVWYATLAHYVQYGWILTVFLTAASVKSLNLLFNWEAASGKFVQFIESSGKKLWYVDLFVAALGIIFLLLGIFVF